MRIIPNLRLKLMPIPAGTFLMGGPEGESTGEGPPTHVTISRDFWLGQTEVTQAQWLAVMGTGLLDQARRLLADDTLYKIDGKSCTMRALWHRKKHSDPLDLIYNDDANAPVYYVKWNEAATFCRQLTEIEGAAGRLPAGYEYRLPYEAEWEYACRAGTTTLTYVGDLVKKRKFKVRALRAIAWYGANSSVGYKGRGVRVEEWPEGHELAEKYPVGPAAQRIVGAKDPNAWGLYDMLGNVWEWCSDWYHKRLPGGSVVDPIGPIGGFGRVIRGGCWRSNAVDCRCARRDAYDPRIRDNVIGFRVALSSVRERR